MGEKMFYYYSYESLTTLLHILEVTEGARQLKLLDAKTMPTWSKIRVKITSFDTHGSDEIIKMNRK